MSWVLAGLGWGVAALLVIALRSRAALVADAEHELRGAATALGFAAERMRRAGASRAFASLVAVQLDRMTAGLADLERARGRPRGGGVVGRVPAALDSGRLAQVVTNLVANAAEHGRGPVEVRWNATAAGARLEIRNRNRPAELADLAAARGAPGRGRGTGIARRAARELGGSLRVETGEEETVATVELPRAAAGERASGERGVSEHEAGEGGVGEGPAGEGGVGEDAAGERGERGVGEDTAGERGVSGHAAGERAEATSARAA